MLYRHLRHHNGTIINTDAKDFFNKIFVLLTLFIRFERVVQGLRVRGFWRPNRNFNILISTLMTVNVASFSFLDAQPEALGSTLLGAGFLYCILWSSSLDPNSSGPKGPFRLMWLSLPLLVYLRLQLYWNSDCLLDSNSSELYNGSTPTRSLKSHVWSSSSGNNCRAVHRSLSSGASVYEYTMRIF